jgi:hypothetical protein
MNTQIQETELEDFKPYPSKTYAVKTGCGNMYVTVMFVEDKPNRIFIHRSSNLQCDLIYLDSLQRQSTFQTQRDMKQLIKDLRGNEGHCCKTFNISLKNMIKNGKLAAFSCPDAIARVLAIVSNEQKTHNKEN